MQDIFCDEPEPVKRREKQSHAPPANDVFDYLMNRHVKLYGEQCRTYFSKENRKSIATFVAATKLPFEHFISFIFRELPDTKIFTNVIASKNWIPRFNSYLETLNLPVEVYQLKSPHALPCWGEYQTFLNCMRSFVADGKSPALLINNFIFSKRISDLTLAYIYDNLELQDPFLSKYFNSVKPEFVMPYENIGPDMDYILQHYAN